MSSIAEDAAGETYLTTSSGPGAATPRRAAGTLELRALRDQRLCLGVGGRYRVAARWADTRGRAGGDAHAVGLTNEAGYFRASTPPMSSWWSSL